MWTAPVTARKLGAPPPGAPSNPAMDVERIAAMLVHAERHVLEGESILTRLRDLVCRMREGVRIRATPARP